MSNQLSMLDLFSGTGSASRAAEVRGWRILRIDIDPYSTSDEKHDLQFWRPPAIPRWDLIWASPPCTLLSTARSDGRDIEKGLVLVKSAIEIIRFCAPRWWVIENVHGATRAISRLLGSPVERYGSFYLWGCFPPFRADIPRNKTRLSGRRRAERRARIPWEISYGLITACEHMAVEIGIISDAGGGATGAGSELAPTAVRAASSVEIKTINTASNLDKIKNEREQRWNDVLLGIFQK